MADLTRTDRRILQARQEIAERPQPASAQIAYCARELVVATLPHRQPPADKPEWVRRDGYYTLSIRPGYGFDPSTGQRVSLGYPFGVIPRLVILWLTTEAVRTGRRRLVLGDSFSAFIRLLGLSPDTGGGPRSDFRRLHEQLERLFRATFSFDYQTPDHTAWTDLQVAPRGCLWWSPQPDRESSEGVSWIELGETFFEAITARPVPLDLRAVRALQSSPLALDLYAWVSFRYFVVCERGTPAFVPWRGLMAQLGSTYRTVKNFSQRCRPVLRRLRILYPSLSLRPVRGGLELRPGRPLITST